MIDERTLHVINSECVTTQRYPDEILESYVRHFRGAYGPDFIFIDDNVHPYRANLVDDFLENKDIERITAQ